MNNQNPIPNFAPWRKVVDSERYWPASAPRGAFARILKLECGHELHRKGSQGVPKKSRCIECLSKGSQKNV